MLLSSCCAYLFMGLLLTGGQFSVKLEMNSKFETKTSHLEIPKEFQKLECDRFIPYSGTEEQKNSEQCACGLERVHHATQKDGEVNEVWCSEKHTLSSPTNAYGTIQFDGTDPNKAHFIRLSRYTQPGIVIRLMIDHWQIKKPKLVISIRGGQSNFKLNPELKNIIGTGLVRTAQSTGKNARMHAGPSFLKTRLIFIFISGAWLLTDGTTTGVTRQIGNALKPHRSSRPKGKRLVSIGIAPWGVIENRDKLVVRNKNVVCSSIDRPHSKSALNSSHSTFMLVDDGTIGRYGGEIVFRFAVVSSLNICNFLKFNFKSCDPGESWKTTFPIGSCPVTRIAQFLWSAWYSRVERKR